MRRQELTPEQARSTRSSCPLLLRYCRKNRRDTRMASPPEAPPSNPSIRGAGSHGRVMPRTVCEAASDRKSVGDAFSGAPGSCHWPPSAYIPAGKEAAMTRELRGC